MEKHLRHLPKTEKGDKCLNCGHNLDHDDNFCPRCSQLNNIKRVTFMDWIREILGDFFAYDSRVKNSLIPLLLNPGQLSIDYNKGQRASHIHPVRLYLVVSFILFLSISLVNLKEDYAKAENTDTVDLTESSLNGSNKASIYSVFDKQEIDDTLIDISRKNYVDRFILYLLDIKKHNNINYKAVSDRYNFEKTTLDRFTYNKAVEYSTFTFDKLGSYIFKKLPIIAFIFLPFFVLFLNLIHYKKDILYLEHLVFAFHAQSTFFFLILLSEIVTLISEPLGDFIGYSTMFVIFPIYLFLALKKFYQYKTIMKTVLMFAVINFIYIATASLAFLFGVFFALFSY